MYLHRKTQLRLSPKKKSPIFLLLILKFLFITSNFKALIYFLVALCFFSANINNACLAYSNHIQENEDFYQSNNEIKKYGVLTEFGYRLIEHLRDARIPDQNITYINASLTLEADIQDALRQSIQDGDYVIIDGTTSDSKQTSEISAALSGVGMDGNIVIIKTSAETGIPSYKTLQFSSTTNGFKSHAQLTTSDLTTLSEEAIHLLKTWQHKNINDDKTKQTRTYHETIKWKPEASTNIEIRRIGMSCNVGAKFNYNMLTGIENWSDGMVDPCNKKASVSLIYTVDFIRSQSTTSSSNDAKYVRITMDPESYGGAGWHLTDKPTEKITWFESWTNRESWFGPVVDNYQIGIQSLDKDVKLYQSIPENQPKNSMIVGTTRLEVGVTPKLKYTYQEKYSAEQLFVKFMDENPNYSPATEEVCDFLSYCQDTVKNPECHPKDTQTKCCPLDTPTSNTTEQATTITTSGNTSQQQKGSCCCCSGKTNVSTSSNSQSGSTSGMNYSAMSSTTDTKINHNTFNNKYDEDDDEHVTNNTPKKETHSCCKDKHEIHIDNNSKDNTNPFNLRKYRGIEASANFSYMSKRSISYPSNEYETVNLSKAGTYDTAGWLWTRNFDQYRLDWRTNKTCALWCQDDFFDVAQFSGSAYNHFVPGFSATFIAPAQKENTSKLRINASMTPVALGGRVQYKGLFQLYSPVSMQGTTQKLSQLLVINWNAPIFQGATPIALQAYKTKDDNGICLSSYINNNSNFDVFAKPCTNHASQIWFADNINRYKLITNPNYCLTHSSNHTPVMEKCSNNSNQKWFWEENHLSNVLGGFLSLDDQNNPHIIDTAEDDTTTWREFIRNDPTSAPLHMIYNEYK